MYSYNEKISEIANIAVALYSIANELNRLGLGNASTNMGAIEGHTVKMAEAFSGISSSLDGIASAITDSANP